MIHQAAALQDQVRAHDKLFLDPYAKPQSPTLTECASVWLSPYGCATLCRDGQSDAPGVCRSGIVGVASEARSHRHAYGPMLKAGGIRIQEDKIVNSATVDGWFDPISLEIDTVFGTADAVPRTDGSGAPPRCFGARGFRAGAHRKGRGFPTGDPLLQDVSGSLRDDFGGSEVLGRIARFRSGGRSYRNEDADRITGQAAEGSRHHSGQSARDVGYSRHVLGLHRSHDRRRRSGTPDALLTLFRPWAADAELDRRQLRRVAHRDRADHLSDLCARCYRGAAGCQRVSRSGRHRCHAAPLGGGASAIGERDEYDGVAVSPSWAASRFRNSTRPSSTYATSASGAPTWRTIS